MLGVLTATKRADAAESLSACEQVFRVLLDQEYTKARRILDLHSNLLLVPAEGDIVGINKHLVGQSEQKQASTGEESETPDLPI